MAESNYQKIDASCLLLQVQGGETSYIRKGEIFTIGRSKKNNLVINDPTVSRFHATIKWEDEFPIIRDNGSTAGLLINGKQVECAQLIIIHLISLGGTKIVAEYSPSEASTPTKTMLPVASSAVLNSLDDIDDVVLFLEHGVDDITGSLNSNKKIHDLLVYLELHKRSGTLTFQGEMNAKIIFTLGKILHVECGHLTGALALQYICSFSRANYVFTVRMEVKSEEPLNISACYFLREYEKRDNG